MENGIINMDDILNSTFGETSSSIRATFKKTINIKQYETESIEVSSTLDLERELTGVERMIISAILQAQIEYEAYIQLRFKGLVTETEFYQRKASLEQEVQALKVKAEAILGKSFDNMFTTAND